MDEVLGEAKLSTWNSQKQLFPIPKSEIQKNPSLVGHQNPGY
ncbi:MAG: RagB/SusD family nutrient uptake outer membrane protein [Chitinophagaceae bacterium]|nr:RagB/SusD family nutrient uptake outer membrane protein [Chitinophagaceae bacterium]